MTVDKDDLEKVAPDEEWKPISGYYEDCYLISNYGRVFSIRSRQLVKTYPSTHGYMATNICKKGKIKRLYIARVVGLHFVEGYFPDAQVNHKDLNKTNDYYKNLEWVTRLDNIRHAYANRTIRRNGTTSEKHIAAMRVFRKPIYAHHVESGKTLRFESGKACAEFFGVSAKTIYGTIAQGHKLKRQYKLIKEKDYEQFQRVIEGL